MAEPSDTLIEEREELMVSPADDANPTLRTAHFLKPCITGPVFELPSFPLSSKATTSELKKLPPNVQFKGRRNPPKNWKTWVDQLHCIHQSTWKKAGIYGAIMSSTYHIQRHNDLVLEIAEKWCSETNTFIFPWGEATITLEDMMVLGGYSVLGDSVLSPLENREMVEMRDKLIEAYTQITRTNRQLASHYGWMDQFMGSGLEIEHEAFLALWLSRYVFPENLYNAIGKHLFPIAIRLARGTPIALAPAVLASLYKDLGLLKEKIFASNELGAHEDNDNGSLILWAPFHLLQLWVWERFPTLRPKANVMKYGEPRLARWHKLKKLKVENVRLAIDSAGECFRWRPYATAVNNWSIHKFYKENEEWVLVGSDLDEELKSFARCLRVCELVGLDCIEQYLPHRVAMQFGFDQDIPDCVHRSNETSEIAWCNYNRPIYDAKLYMPPRLFESDVTRRYSRWWKQSLTPKDAIKVFVRKRRSSVRLPRHSKRNKEAEDSVNEENLTILEPLRSTDKHNSVGNRLVSDVKPSLGTLSRTLSSCAVSSVMIREEKLLMKPVEKIMQSEALARGSEKAMEDANENIAKSPVNNTVSINGYNGVSSSYGTIAVRGLELEARISKLEETVAGLKVKHGYKFEK